MPAGRARRTVTAAQELKLLELPGIPGGGTDGTGLGRRKRQGRTRPYDSGSGSGSPGGSDEQTTALPRQLNSKLRRLGRPGGRSPGDSGGSGAHSAAAGPSHQPARGLDAPASAAGMLYGWHGGAGGVPGLQPSPWMAPALFGGGAGVPPLPLAAQHSSATSPAMLLELQHLDTVHGMHMRGPDAPGGHGALPGSAAAAAADGALMAASDLDLLLALGPEDLADCLLGAPPAGGGAWCWWCTGAGAGAGWQQGGAVTLVRVGRRRAMMDVGACRPGAPLAPPRCPGVQASTAPTWRSTRWRMCWTWRCRRWPPTPAAAGCRQRRRSRLRLHCRTAWCRWAQHSRRPPARRSRGTARAAAWAQTCCPRVSLLH